jgi:hypothetical protein
MELRFRRVTDSEGVGFEPTETLRFRLISSQVPSTNSATLPSHRNEGGEDILNFWLVDDLVPGTGKEAKRRHFASPEGAQRDRLQGEGSAEGEAGRFALG